MTRLEAAACTLLASICLFVLGCSQDKRKSAPTPQPEPASLVEKANKACGEDSRVVGTSVAADSSGTVFSVWVTCYDGTVKEIKR